jgi:tetratricopeptide (TPR) repeat protein
MSASIKIEKWLKGGGDLESYFEANALKVKNPNETALLRRCALVRSFDAQLLAGPLSRNLPKGARIDFEKFVDDPEMNRSARQSGEYSLKQSARDGYLAWWGLKEHAAELRRFCRSMLSYYEKEGAELDAFGQRAIVAPKAAHKQFLEWYRKADRRADLAECESLLNLLRSYGDLLREPLVGALKDRERYFAGRVMFADDWTRTERFLERDGVTRRFAKFLRNPGKWIFHMHASGGSGKTAYLRWLTARYCVTERNKSRQRIPVAKIDMDFVRLASLDSAPWLILIPAADQLDQQIPGRPFASPMATWLDKAPPLDRFATSTTQAPVTDEAEAASCAGDFRAALGSRRVFLILDTLEEMVLRHGQSLASILQILAQVRQGCPGFHVVLSGRYDLRKRSETAEAMRSFRRDTVSLSVAKFSRAEAIDYLRRVRGLRGNFALGAMVKASGRNPFKLALYADLASARGSMTSKHVGELGDIAHEYLIERIIERIPDSEMPLRWVLRYAVVPRPGLLTFEYLEDVLRPHLEREMRQKGLLLLDRAESSVWRPESGTFTLQQVWDTLLLYRSPSGWIDVIGGRPLLQPEIVVPMRALLQKEKIFCPLHKNSADYFEKQGNRVEALYHRFWAEGPAAKKYWETYLSEAKSLDEGEALASLICSGDLLDEDDRPLRHEVFGSVVGLDTVADAAFELASIAIRRHLLGQGESALQRKASNYLRRVAKLEKWLSHKAIDSSRRALVEAALLEALRKNDEAIAVADRALGNPHPRTDLISLEILKARLIESRDPDAAAGCLGEAARLARNAAHPAVSYSWICGRLGRLQYEHDHLDRAGECYRRALESLESKEGNGKDVVSMLQSLTQLSRSSLQFSEIQGWIERAERFSSELPEARDFVSHQRARLALDRGELREAASLGDYGNLGDVAGAFGRQRELWAESSWARQDYKMADGGFEQAFGFYKKDGTEDAMINVSLRRGRMAAEDMGNLRQAPETRISSRHWSPAQQGIALELRLIRLAKAGRVDEAQQAWAKPAFPLGNGRVAARYFAVGLALELAYPPAAYDSMLKALAMVEPWQARLPILDPFRHFSGEPVGISSELQNRFIALHPAPDEAGEDFPFQALALADALRYGGGNKGAAYLLKEALKRTPASWIGVRRRLILAAQRLELILPDQTLWDFLRDADRESESVDHRYLPLRTVARVELAEWWLKRGKRQHAAEALRGCAPDAVAGSQYEMRFYLVQAAAILSDRAHANAYTRALQLAGEMGWPPPPPPSSIDVVSLPVGRPAEQPLYPGRRIVTIRPEPEIGPPRNLVIMLEDPPGQLAVGRLDLKRDAELREVIFSDSRTAAADYLQDFGPAIDRLRLLLPDPLSRRQSQRNRGDIALVTPPGTLAGLPYEAAAERSGIRFLFRQAYYEENPRDTIVWLQRWLTSHDFPVTVDGVAGPKTWEMLSRASKVNKTLVDGWDGLRTRKKMCPPLLQQASIITLQSSTHEQHSRERGYSAQGISLEQAYSEQGLRCESVYLTPTFPSQLESAMGRSNRPVLHVTLDLVDAREGASLRVQDADSSDGMRHGRGGPTTYWESEITASRLGSLLDEGKGLPSAFVILDPPHPGNPREWARQLVLRNQFAHELLATRCVWGVLATGLAGPDRGQIEAQLQRLIASMATRPLAGEMAQVCDRFSALFCWDPLLPVW